MKSLQNILANICPLCQKIQSCFYHRDNNRDYLQCQHCHLVYVPDNFHLSPEDEKKQYDFHTNNPEDIHYRKFLSRLFSPLLEHLKKPSQGLDFGSGPGPTLSIMFQEKGFNMAIYDKFYADDKHIFTQHYDFITATEVIEHLTQPAKELKRLISMINSKGYLGIMTKQVIDKEQFSHWHYKNDLTHICFYSKETFLWIAKTYSLESIFIGSDVIILQKD